MAGRVKPYLPRQFRALTHPETIVAEVTSGMGAPAKARERIDP